MPTLVGGAQDARAAAGQEEAEARQLGEAREREAAGRAQKKAAKKARRRQAEAAGACLRPSVPSSKALTACVTSVHAAGMVMLSRMQ